MRKVVLAAAVLAVLPLTASGAKAQYAPWCAYYTVGGTNCGFHSFGQCQAAVSGIGGTCSPNPAAPGANRGRGPRFY